MECDEQQPSRDRQVDNADRKNEPSSPYSKRARKKSVFSDDAAHAGKISKACIGGQGENSQRAGERQIIKPVTANNRRGELRQDTLINPPAFDPWPQYRRREPDS